MHDFALVKLATTNIRVIGLFESMLNLLEGWRRGAIMDHAGPTNNNSGRCCHLEEDSRVILMGDHENTSTCITEVYT